MNRRSFLGLVAAAPIAAMVPTAEPVSDRFGSCGFCGHERQCHQPDPMQRACSGIGGAYTKVDAFGCVCAGFISKKMDVSLIRVRGHRVEISTSVSNGTRMWRQPTPEDFQ